MGKIKQQRGVYGGTAQITAVSSVISKRFPQQGSPLKFGIPQVLSDVSVGHFLSVKRSLMQQQLKLEPDTSRIKCCVCVCVQSCNFSRETQMVKNSMEGFFLLSSSCVTRGITLGPNTGQNLVLRRTHMDTCHRTDSPLTSFVADI